MKVCSKCYIEKNNDRFDHHKGQCKDCRNSMKRNRDKNKEFTPVTEKICGVCKVLKLQKEFNLSKRLKHGLTRECKVCRVEISKERYSRKKEKIKARTSEYYYANKPTIMKKALIYQKKRLKTDHMYLMSRRLRNRLYHALKNKNWKKHTKFTQYIGCDQESLINHIQKQFTENMSWENQGEWHIDHIVPLDSAQTEEELYRLCHYTNLQPMWALDNIRKGIS